MEQNHVEERSLVQEPPLRQHWTATLTQVLLFLSLLSYLLLGGIIFPRLITWYGYGTMLDVSVWGLAALFSVLLCAGSSVALVFARQWQWRRGRKLARWGLAVGILGVLLVLGVLVAKMSIDVSHIGGHCVKHSVSDPCKNTN